MRGISAFFSAIFAGLVAAGIALGLVSLFAAPELGVWRFAALITAPFITLILGWIIAIPAGLMVGIPIHIALRSLGLVSPWHYALAGMVFGAILSGWLAERAPRSQEEMAFIFGVTFTAGSAVAGWTFRNVLDGRNSLYSLLNRPLINW